MQPGIFAKTFVRPSVDEVFAAVAKHRIHCVQFNFSSAGLPSLPDEVDPAVADRIRKSAAQQRIEIAAISGTFNMIHPDPQVRRDGLRRLEVIAGSCRHLETKLVTLCTGTRDPEDMWRAHPGNNTEEAWRDLVATLTKALTTAAKHGISLGIEPETGNVINSARNARRLLDEMKSPRLKIIFDAANLFLPGDLRRMTETLEEAVDLLGPDIALVHAKELDASHSPNLPLGQGVLDWDRYVTLLQAANYTGPWIMHGFREKDVDASLEFIRSKLSEPNR